MSVRYTSILSVPRNIVKSILNLVYPMVVWLLPLPKVLSIEDTLKKMLVDRSSISRFGDGEFLYVVDKISLPFQRYDPRLAEKLKSILSSNQPNHLVALPNAYHSMQNLRPEVVRTWKSQISWIYPRLRKYLDLHKVYYNANVTRLYMPFVDKSKCRGYFEMIMQLWKGRKILLVEGEKSRLGVGNGLFDSALSVERILAPKHHAFTKYDELIAEILKKDKSYLVLAALGPTATALCYDLAIQGYHAVDIGNIDLEYEWYQRQATVRIKIEGKYTSEVRGGREVSDVNDPKYLSQIIATII